MAGDVISLGERRESGNKQAFVAIAAEIKRGTMQLHFADVERLFAQTDEILFFALSGSGNPSMPKHTPAECRQKIQTALNKIEEMLVKNPKADCQAVRESIAKVKAEVGKIIL